MRNENEDFSLKKQNILIINIHSLLKFLIIFWTWRVDYHFLCITNYRNSASIYLSYISSIKKYYPVFLFPLCEDLNKSGATIFDLQILLQEHFDVCFKLFVIIAPCNYYSWMSLIWLFSLLLKISRQISYSRCVS